MNLDTVIEEDSDDGDVISELIDDFTELATDDMTLISHSHGRVRRAERNITKPELKKALKYARALRTYGPKGQPRWRFQYNGVVYITDDTRKHEITSWRYVDNIEALGGAVFGQLAGHSIHVVLVIDHSGSMRKDDAPGYDSRIEAVYQTLIRELIRPQLDLMSTAAGACLGEIAVSVLRMSSYFDDALIVNRVAVDEDLCTLFSNLGSTISARGHGHYLDALHELEKLLEQDAKKQVFTNVFFVSDGEPSDHIDLACKHGVHVWEADETDYFSSRGRQKFKQCYGVFLSQNSMSCRKQVKDDVVDECCRLVKGINEMMHDKFSIQCIAFGSPDEDYSVLRKLSSAVPKGSFQKLGVAVKQLGNALSTFSSTITEMRTMGGAGLTLRDKKQMETKQENQEELAELSTKRFDIYINDDVVSKKKYNVEKEGLVDVDYFPGSIGVAFATSYFAQGAERIAHRCFEVTVDSSDPNKFLATGGRELVGKETLFKELLRDSKFHREMAKTQATAQRFANIFNGRIKEYYPNRQDLLITFADCCIYEVRDDRFPQGVAWILAEPKLDGKWTKWNNNNGKVFTDDEMFTEDLCKHVPQAFSHFTYIQSQNQKLVCDLQGVWNSEDGFTLTDPVIHSCSKKKSKRSTDKGVSGMNLFHESHKCSEMCRLLGNV